MLVNDTTTPAWLLGESGNDILVGGTGTDVLVGGNGVDAMLGNKGNDFVIADLQVAAVEIAPSGMVTAKTKIVTTGGDLVLGNLGDGNDFGFYDEGMALVPPGAPSDYADEIENLFEEVLRRAFGLGCWPGSLCLRSNRLRISSSVPLKRSCMRLVVHHWICSCQIGRLYSRLRSPSSEIPWM